MRAHKLYNVPFLSILILFLCLIAFTINHFIYHFPGNNFFPDDMPLLTSIILLMNVGLLILFGKDSRASKSGIEFFYFFVVMSVIALASNAVQLTPFPTIDKQILTIEEYFHINIPQILAWTNNHPHLKVLLGFIYDTLPYQMAFIPLIIIASGQFDLLKEYYFLLLCTALIGFCFYYFFPTTAPASITNSPFFSLYQIATGLKFNQIHHHIVPTTTEGGLIAFPSFHTIWALLNVYLLKKWPVLWISLLIVNIMLIASCVLLGWHYVLDIISALILLAISFYWLKLYKINLLLKKGKA
jgi:hypothetical protein